jgi:hypothetical protein
VSISHEELMALFTARNADQVYVVQFANGMTVELTEFQVSGEPGDREYVATIVRPGAGCVLSAGEALLFKISEVASVQLSERGFDYYR